MKWHFLKEQGEDEVVLYCSVCYSKITVKYGEVLPYCKKCESEPECDIVIQKIRRNICGSKIKIDNKLDNLDNDLAHNMTYDEIIQTLEHDAVSDFDRWVIDLIKHQKDENKSLIAAQKTLRIYTAQLNKELKSEKRKVDRLKAELEGMSKPLSISEVDISMEQLKELLKNSVLSVFNENVRESTVREFIERFLAKIHEHHYLLSDKINSTDYGMFTVGIEQAVKETEKEMVGDCE